MTESLPTKLQFSQYHRPGLADGDYTITVTQTIQTDDDKIPTTTFSAARDFAVQGARFALQPTDVYAFFPPHGSLGDHTNVLPHIALTRSTLPWERSAGGTDDPPWLALLLFDDAETPTPNVIPLGELTDGSAKYPDTTTESLETGQASSDNITVVDIPWGTLQKLLPSAEDLSLLAHVRQGTDDSGNLVGEELAVLICNRLPLAGATSTVHLVSLEGRYTASGFDAQDAADDDLVRLISLRSWSFTCTDPAQSFSGLLENIDLAPSTLRLPAVGNDTADRYLEMGYVPLPHHLRRDGLQTVSWYRGPLSPSDSSTELALPARAADELLTYNLNNGLLDASYAAAWEIGRLLALQSKPFSLGLYNWKRACARQAAAAAQAEDYAHLDIGCAATEAPALPDTGSSWLSDLGLLQGIPFNYLVPDERMLPQESLRFFNINTYWMACLFDGAFSIGRTTTTDLGRDAEAKALIDAYLPQDISGFLLRSDLVSGWPGLLVAGYDTIYDDTDDISSETTLPLVRMDRLSANVLLCLFEGQVRTVEMRQKPEALHFGLDAPSNDVPVYHKVVKPVSYAYVAVSWKNDDETTRVIDISSLATAIQEATVAGTSSANSASFARRMLESVDNVRFVQTKA